jgi:dienelactone hydrolase
VIPVERINGPVFLDCGGDDLLWTSCAYADAIMSRLNANDDPHSHVLETYPDAGHGVGVLLPYEPASSGGLAHFLAGATPDANEQALVNLWPKVLAFLQAAR